MMNADQLTEMAKSMAINVARNAGVVPEVCFPHIYLGLQDHFKTQAAIAPPVAAGSVDRSKLLDMTLADTKTRDWYFDCDGHYIDVELRKDGHYSIYFRNRADGGQGWLDTGLLRERAEKAESELAQVNEWRAAALTSNQQLQELMAAKLAAAEARVKELQRALLNKVEENLK